MSSPTEEKWGDYSGIKRNPRDSDVVRRMWQIFSSRLFPVLALTYIASVMGLSLSRGTYFLYDKEAFFMAYVILVWVSIAPLVWITLHASNDVRHYGRVWYLWTAGSQGFCGILFYILFPDTQEQWLWGLQTFFVSSIPIHVVIYFFFMKGGLPQSAAWPLTLSGIVFMLYGVLFA